MSRGYINLGNGPVRGTRREPVEVMKIKFSFAGITILLLMSLLLFGIVSWPWLKSLLTS